jgi:hypothetical protein
VLGFVFIGTKLIKMRKGLKLTLKYSFKHPVCKNECGNNTTVKMLIHVD